MDKFKYDLALAAATSKTTADLIKNPQLKVASVIITNFVAAYKSFETENGQKNLKTAAEMLNNFQ